MNSPKFNVGDKVCFKVPAPESEILRLPNPDGPHEIVQIVTPFTETDNWAYYLKTALSDKTYYCYGENKLVPLEEWHGEYDPTFEEILMEHDEAVDHPSHYNQGKYECIEVAEEIGISKCAYLFNAFKYIWRCADKHADPREDIKKAIWYLNYKLDRLNEQLGE